MLRRIGLFLAWLVATAAVTFITWQAVSAAGSGVADRPLFPVAASITTLPQPTTSTRPPTPSPSTTLDFPEVDGQPESTSTSAVPTTESVPAQSPATTVSPDTTPPPTTEAPGTSDRRAFNLVGGRVVLDVGDGEVEYVSAVPNPGYKVDVEETGPKEVHVIFESKDHTSELKAKWKGGELVIDRIEEPDDDRD